MFDYKKGLEKLKTMVSDIYAGDWEGAWDAAQDPCSQAQAFANMLMASGKPEAIQSAQRMAADAKARYGCTITGVPMENGRGPQPAGDPANAAKTQHEDQARAITYQLLGKPCAGDVELPGGVFDRCRPGMDGTGYTIDSSRYPLTGKQLTAAHNAVKSAAMLGTGLDDMLARGQAAATAELAKVGITPKPGTELGGGGGDGDTGTPAAVVKKSNTVAMAGMGLVGGAIALGVAWYIGKAVKLK